MTNLQNVHLDVRLNNDKFNNSKQRTVGSKNSNFGESIFTSEENRFNTAINNGSSGPFGSDYVEVDVRQMAIDGGQKTWHPIRLFVPKDVAEEMGLPLMDDKGKTEKNPEITINEVEDETDNKDEQITTQAPNNPWANADSSAGFLFDYTRTFEYPDGSVEEEYINPNAKEGEVFCRNTITKPDGTVVVMETVKGAEGEDDKRTKTTKNPDGSSEVETTEKNQDGSYTTTTEKTNADGTKTTVKRTDYPDDTWVEETTDANGNVTTKKGKYDPNGI